MIIIKITIIYRNLICSNDKSSFILIDIEYELITENIVKPSKNNINKKIISNTIDNKKILVGIEVNIKDNVNDTKDIYKFTNTNNNTLVYDNDKIVTINVSNVSQNYSIEELVFFSSTLGIFKYF